MPSTSTTLSIAGKGKELAYDIPSLEKRIAGTHNSKCWSREIFLMILLEYKLCYCSNFAINVVYYLQELDDMQCSLWRVYA
jgi:hypothetical protein